MIKVILTKNNYIIKPRGRYNQGSVYEDTMAFETYEQRDNYIEDHIHPNFKEDLSRMDKLGRSTFTSTTAVFDIDQSYYSESLEELMTKNYAIAEVKNGGTIEYKFYHINSLKVNNKIISATGILDPFMTYTLNDIFEGELHIKRAHVKRNNAGEFPNFSLDNVDLQTKEDILEKLTFKGEKVLELKQSGLTFSGANQEEEDELEEIVRNTNWGVIYYTAGQSVGFGDIDSVYGVSSSTYGSNNGYKIIIAPHSEEYTFTIKDLESSGAGQEYIVYNWDLLSMTQFIQNGNNTNVNSFLSLSTTDYIPEGKYEFIEKNGRKYIEFTPATDKYYKGMLDNGMSGNLKSVIQHLTMLKSEQDISLTHDGTLFPLSKLSDYTNPKRKDDEIKLMTQGRSITILDSKDSIDIDISLLGSYVIQLGMLLTFEPANSMKVIYVKSGLYDLSKQDLSIITSGNDNELPWGKDRYAEWVGNHRVSAKVGLLLPMLTFAGGIAGSKPSIASLGLQQELREIANRQDLKRGSDTVVKGSGGMISAITGIKEIRVIVNSLIPKDEQIFYDILFKKGWTINKIGKINDYIFTRYYFNHLQTEDAYANISNKLPDNVKEIISDSLSSDKGLTFWYYRDKETFKGIRNYEYENSQV